MLAEIAEGEGQDTRYWLEQIAERAGEIREEALNRLVAERHPGTAGRPIHVDVQVSALPHDRRPEPEREVKLRIMGVLFSDEIPDPRDVMIICLVDACGIFKELLSRRQLGQVAPRIEMVRKLDLIGQAMSQAIRDIELTVISSMQPHLY